MKKLQLTALMMIAALLAACNTVEGIGADIKGAGTAIESSASKSK